MSLNDPPNIGLVIPATLDPAIQQRIRSTYRDLMQHIGDPATPGGVRDIAKQAFDSFRESAEKIGVQFVPGGEAPAGPPPLSPDLAGGPLAGISAQSPVPPSTTPIGPQLPFAAQFGGSGGPGGAIPAPSNPTGQIAGQNMGPTIGVGRSFADPLARSRSPRELGPGGPPAPEAAGPATAADRVPDSGIFPTPADLGPEPESADLIALRKALAEPPPKLDQSPVSKAEGIALGFLAGLKGINEVMPFIAMRQRRAEQKYSAETDARREKLGGLQGLAAITEREQTARQALQLRTMQQQFSNDYRTASMANMLSMRQEAAARIALAKQTYDLRATKMIRPSDRQFDSLALLGNLYTRALEARELIKAGFGGPVEGRIPVIGTFNPTPDNIRKAAQLKDALDYTSTNTKHDLLGAAMTPTELAGLIGAVPSFTGIKTKNLVNIDSYTRQIEQKVRSLANVYNPELVAKAFGVPLPGLIPATSQGADAGAIDSHAFSAGDIPPLPPGLVSGADDGTLLYDDSEAP